MQVFSRSRLSLKMRFLAIFLLLAPHLYAQQFTFSTDPNTFAQDLSNGIRQIDNEGAAKIAADFVTVWNAGQISPEQKTIIIQIAKKMSDRRMRTYPYFEYFAAYIAYAIQKENIAPGELTNLLKINSQVVDTYANKPYGEFLLMLNQFFARRALYHTHYFKLFAEGGTYSFELADAAPEYIVPEEEPLTTEVVDETIATDGWGTEDTSDNGWGTTADSGWGNPADGGWDAEPVAEEEPVQESLIAEVTSQNPLPEISGPSIKLNNVNFRLVSPYDSVTVENTSGSVVIKDKVFVGSGGSFKWPENIGGTTGAVVEFGEYSFEVFKPEISAEKVSLTFPTWFDGKAEGIFDFKSHRRNAKNEHYFPQFTSYYSDIKLKLMSPNASYTGGFSIIGDKFYGTSVLKRPSVLTVKDDFGRSFKARAVKYAFEDSLILSDGAVIAIYHDDDSIFHPQNKLDFDQAKNHLTLLKDQGKFKGTPYTSTFFLMDFNADMINWDLNTDSLDISIMNARNRIPAVFESHDYFSEKRFSMQPGLFGYHPVMAVVRYARKVGGSEFYLSDMTNEFKLDHRLSLAAMDFLYQNGFISFQRETGYIKVKEKSFHYILSNQGLKDFDNLIVPSVTERYPNGTFNFKEKELTVRGVSRVYITPDLDIYMEPDSGVVKILQGRDLLFDGMVNAGDFVYKGKDFQFQYNEYLFAMPQIDSIRIQIPVPDSLRVEGGEEKTALNNHIEETSGSLFVDIPDNKSGKKQNKQYPYFTSDSDAVVYFDSKEILRGAYDKTVRFLIPPFTIDSTNRSDGASLGFDGTFYASNMLEPIEERLVVQPDKSLGFEHKIPEQGYKLYGGTGTLYNNLSLDYQGLRADGKIDYLTTTVYSNDFIFYLDSVSAIGSNGEIRPGQLARASFPQAVMGQFRMKWLPKKDSMFLKNLGDPIELYNGTASLQGATNITTKGAFGSGNLETRGSTVESKAFSFAETKFSANHAEFEILSDIPGKPAMAGEDIALNFDLAKNVADVHPEKAGVAAIGFPYAQMKTSITNAVWNLDDQKITMSKPEDVDIADSYFYSTRPDLDSLAFNATAGIYDISTYQLNLQGIPFIKVADAEITPENEEITILENSTLQELKNAVVRIDTANRYHTLTNGSITIVDRNKFTGSAMYQLVNAAEDTFTIKFDQFLLQNVPIAKNKYKTMTVSEGEIMEEQDFVMSPGFLYKGRAKMFADRRALELTGGVKLDWKKERDTQWINYQNKSENPEVLVEFNSSTSETGLPLIAGLHYDTFDDMIYLTFVQDKNNPEDFDLFVPKGILSYNLDGDFYKIEEPAKADGSSYAGSTFIYSESTNSVIFEGPVNFIKNSPDFAVKASAKGLGRLDSSYFKMSTILTVDFKANPMMTDAMVKDMVDIIERLGAPQVHDLQGDLVYLLANLTSDATAKAYENNSLKNYVPLVSTSPELAKSLVLSEVNLQWSAKEKAWYNDGKIGISNVAMNDINAESDGFVEIKRDPLGDIVNIFIMFSEATWYHFRYDQNRLLMLSSNPAFNAAVTASSTLEKAGLGAFAVGLGEEAETMTFLNNFRKNYYNISSPFKLQFATDAAFGSDGFDTIEKDKDGF